jgi:segregation and condensation protein B
MGVSSPAVSALGRLGQVPRSGKSGTGTPSAGSMGLMENVGVMEDTALDAPTPEPERSGESGKTPEQLATSIEAILITSDRPVPSQRLAEALGLAQPPGSDKAPESDKAAEGETPAPKPRRRGKRRDPGESDPADLIEAAIELLNGQYAASGRCFRIESVAGGYRVMTLPEMAPVLAAFHKARASNRLSRAAVETLAIIAYKQPLTRAHLESIRGVACGEVLRSLMERRMITIKGRAEELGRPMLYGTTKEFLDAFGLASLKDLPNASELQVNP